MVRICQARRSWSAPKWPVAILTLMRNESPPTTRHGISKRLTVRITCAIPLISIVIVSTLFATPLHKLDPDAFRPPHRFHFGARPGLVHAEYVAAKAIEERRDPRVGYAVHVHRDIL